MLTEQQRVAERQICDLVRQLDQLRIEGVPEAELQHIHDALSELAVIRGPRVVSGAGSAQIPADILQIRFEADPVQGEP